MSVERQYRVFRHNGDVLALENFLNTHVHPTGAVVLSVTYMPERAGELVQGVFQRGARPGEFVIVAYHEHETPDRQIAKDGIPEIMTLSERAQKEKLRMSELEGPVPLKGGVD